MQIKEEKNSSDGEVNLKTENDMVDKSSMDDN